MVPQWFKGLLPTGKERATKRFVVLVCCQDAQGIPAEYSAVRLRISAASSTPLDGPEAIVPRQLLKRPSSSGGGHGHSDQPAGGSEAEVSATWQAHASTLRVHASLRQSKSSGDAWQPQVLKFQLLLQRATLLGTWQPFGEPILVDLAPLAPPPTALSPPRSPSRTNAAAGPVASRTTPITLQYIVPGREGRPPQDVRISAKVIVSPHVNPNPVVPPTAANLASLAGPSRGPGGGRVVREDEEDVLSLASEASSVASSSGGSFRQKPALQAFAHPYLGGTRQSSAGRRPSTGGVPLGSPGGSVTTPAASIPGSPSMPPLEAATPTASSLASLHSSVGTSMPALETGTPTSSAGGNSPPFGAGSSPGLGQGPLVSQRPTPISAPDMVPLPLSTISSTSSRAARVQSALQDAAPQSAAAPGGGSSKGEGGEEGEETVVPNVPVVVPFIDPSHLPGAPTAAPQPVAVVQHAGAWAAGTPLISPATVTDSKASLQLQAANESTSMVPTPSSQPSDSQLVFNSPDNPIVGAIDLQEHTHPPADTSPLLPAPPAPANTAGSPAGAGGQEGEALLRPLHQVQLQPGAAATPSQPGIMLLPTTGPGFGSREGGALGSGSSGSASGFLMGPGSAPSDKLNMAAGPTSLGFWLPDEGEVPLTATGLIVAPVMEGDNEGNDSDSSVLGLGDSLALVPSSAEGGAPLAQGGEPEEIPSMALLPVKGAGLQARGGSGAGADLVGGGHAIVTSLAEPEEVVFPRSFDDGISERSAHGRAPAGVTTTTTSSDIVIGAPPTPAQVPARTTSGISSAEGMVVVAPAVHAYAPSPRLSLDRRQMSASIDRANSGFSSRELFSGGGIHDSMPVISPSAIARARRSRGAGSGFELHSASDLSVPHPGVPLPSDLEEGVVPFAHGWVPLQGREAPGATGALAKQGSGARSAPLFSSSSPRSGPVPGGDNPGPAQQRERQHVPEAAGNPGPEQSERQRVFEAALKDEHEVAEHLVRASVKAEAAADKMLAEAARPVAVPEPAAPGEVHSSSSSSSRPEPSPPGGLLMSIADGAVKRMGAGLAAAASQARSQRSHQGQRPASRQWGVQLPVLCLAYLLSAAHTVAWRLHLAGRMQA